MKGIFRNTRCEVGIIGCVGSILEETEARVSPHGCVWVGAACARIYCHLIDYIAIFNNKITIKIKIIIDNGVKI